MARPVVRFLREDLVTAVRLRPVIFAALVLLLASIVASFVAIVSFDWESASVPSTGRVVHFGLVQYIDCPSPGNCSAPANYVASINYEAQYFRAGLTTLLFVLASYGAGGTSLVFVYALLMDALVIGCCGVFTLRRAMVAANLSGAIYASLHLLAVVLWPSIKSSNAFPISVVGASFGFLVISLLCALACVLLMLVQWYAVEDRLPISQPPAQRVTATPGDWDGGSGAFYDRSGPPARSPPRQAWSPAYSPQSPAAAQPVSPRAWGLASPGADQVAARLRAPYLQSGGSFASALPPSVALYGSAESVDTRSFSVPAVRREFVGADDGRARRRSQSPPGAARAAQRSSQGARVRRAGGSRGTRGRR